MKMILLFSSLVFFIVVNPVCADTTSKLETIQQDLKKDGWIDCLFRIDEPDCSKELASALMSKAESSADIEEHCRYLTASNFVIEMWKKRKGFYPGWNRDLLFGISLDNALFQPEAQRFYDKVVENRTLNSNVREYASCRSAQVDFSCGRRQEGRSKLESLLAANPYCNFARSILRDVFPDDYPPLFSFPSEESASGIFIR